MASKSRPCQRCKTMIPAERIEALPETRLCIQCSQEMGSEFEITVQSENLAKTGSLKKNYGSWTIKKTRKRIEPKE